MLYILHNEVESASNRATLELQVMAIIYQQLHSLLSCTQNNGKQERLNQQCTQNVQTQNAKLESSFYRLV